MKTLTITNAKTNLSAIVESIVTTGDPVVVGRNGKPMVKIIPYQEEKQNCRLGRFSGKVKIREDFDTWDSEEAKALGIED